MIATRRRQPNRQQVSKAVPLPPPIGGLNAREALADMDPKDAIDLTNIFPENNSVNLRRGYLPHVDTATGKAIRSLMTYGATSGNQTLIAGVDGKLWDVTTGATVLSSGFSSDNWQYTNIGTPGGQYMVMVSGFNNPRLFDGAAVTTATFTGSGLTVDRLIDVCLHKERLWFCEKNTLNLWYSATQSIAGALTKFPLGAFAQLGGRLLCAGTLSATAGTTIDDFLAAVTDQGEILLYQGTDPASADTWGLAGRYRVGKPIGNRCLVRIGGDLVVITTEGAVSVRKALEFARGQQDRAAVTDKIQDLFNAAARSFANNFGWQAIVYPRGHQVLFNVPVGQDMSQYQFVMNANTGAWAKFVGWNGGCWGLLNDALYFGGNDGKIYHADVGYQDNTQPVVGTLKSAFSYFGSRNQQKLFTMMRPIMRSNGAPEVAVSLSVDFGNTLPSAVITPDVTSGGVWGVSKWGSGQWAGGGRLSKAWQTVGALGFCGAPGLKVLSNGQSCSIQGFDVLVQPGGVL